LNRQRLGREVEKALEKRCRDREEPVRDAKINRKTQLTRVKKLDGKEKKDCIVKKGKKKPRPDKPLNLGAREGKV